MLSALSKLDDFLQNSQGLVQTGTVPGTSRDTNRENQDRKEDHFWNYAHPEPLKHSDPSVYRCTSQYSERGVQLLS